MAFELKSEQRMGSKAFFVCVLLIELFSILAIDMYAPALPSMQQTFDVSISYLNLTMFAFFFVSAFSTFFAGPLSDCFGRRPVLVLSTIVFAVASLGCTLSPSIEVLVVFRVLQGVGVGAVQTLAAAIVEDAFADDSVKTAITFLQALVIVGPVAAPFLGSLILTFSDWRGIFALLFVLALACVALSLLIRETHEVKRAESTSLGAELRTIFGNCRELVSTRSFLSLTLILALGGVPFFAFIAVASYIAIDFFALDYLGYSLIYALACLVDCVAPFVYMAASGRMPNKRILRLSFVLIGASGVVLLFAGVLSPVVFALGFAVYALAEGIIRPLAFVVLLDQPHDRVGSASALANFAYTFITALATVIATLDWPNLVFGLAVITLATFVLCVLLYWWGLRER